MIQSNFDIPLDHYDTARHDAELASEEIVMLQHVLLQEMSEVKKFDMIQVSIICKSLNMVFGRCSWGALMNYFRELEKPPQITILVLSLEKMLMQDLKSELIRGAITDLLVLLSRISAVKCFSFTDQKLSGLMNRVLHSELSVECKCRAATILANLTMKSLGNLTMDNIVSTLDAVSMTIRSTKCTESASMKLLHQECWRFVLHLSTHEQSRRFTAGRHDIQRLLLNALLDETCVDNRLFATALLKKMSCDTAVAGIIIQIEEGSVVDTLKNKAWFDTDIRVRNASLSSLCQLVESRPFDLAKRPEFISFFSMAVMTVRNSLMTKSEFLFHY